MKRKIITIDEAKCNGCGNCVTACAEGALRIVNGKAKLVKDQFCDGFGACIGDCPTGALQIVEKESDAYDPVATRDYLAGAHGADAVKKFDEAAQRHEAEPAAAPTPVSGHAAMHAAGGCPGSRMRMGAQRDGKPAATVSSGGAQPGHMLASDLQQWPVQLHLVQPAAPFFANKELVVLSTCSPIASADVHWRFIRGRSVVVACPKLDDTERYASKLGAILSEPSIPKALVVRMEVPCCGGLTSIVKEAARLSGRKNLVLEEVTVSLDGDVVRTQVLVV